MVATKLDFVVEMFPNEIAILFFGIAIVLTVSVLEFNISSVPIISVTNNSSPLRFHEFMISTIYFCRWAEFSFPLLHLYGLLRVTFSSKLSIDKKYCQKSSTSAYTSKHCHISFGLTWLDFFFFFLLYNKITN